MCLILFQVYHLAPNLHLEAICCHHLPLKINTIAQEHSRYQEGIQYLVQVLELVWVLHPLSLPLAVEEGHLQQHSGTLQSRRYLLQNVTVKGNLQHLVRCPRNGGHLL
jgi:hypothetical protein